MTFHTAGGKNTGANAFQQAVASQPVKTDKVTPSEGQRRLIESLIKEICEMDETTGNLAIDYTARMDARDAWTRGREGNISRWIERLIGKARELGLSGHPVTIVRPGRRPTGTGWPDDLALIPRTDRRTTP
ncbi:MAG TPA: hypothetical protein VI653_24050 [Steroidobacteraceae bacterium]